MTDPRPDYVYRFEKRGLFHLLFVLSVLLLIWVLVVIYGETQGWGDDPGRWALVPSIGWGLIGLAVFLVFIAMAVAQLIIRERPGQIYRLEGIDTGATLTPSFMQGGPDQWAPTTTTEAATTSDALPETMAEAEPEEKPPQG